MPSPVSPLSTLPLWFTPSEYQSFFSLDGLSGRDAVGDELVVVRS